MEWINQLIDFILHIDSHLSELVATYGIMIYIILFLILFCETGLVIAPFLPGDSLLFAAGTMAATGNMNLFVLCLICILGAVLGNQLNFTIGKYFGPRIFEKDRKYIRKDYLDKTHLFYEKHGGKALILGRYIPFIRTFVPFVAGISQMDSYKFTVYNVGIYRGSGEVREGLVQEILTQIPGERILWEAPQKGQQLYFLELLGCNVNLGNIAPSEVISLEAMRVGLRGDTFSLYLNKETAQ